jgi:hypothetical protein
MTGYDNWDDERARLLHGLDEETESHVRAGLDGAASAARTGDLREAARGLEEVRATLVAINHFRRVDDDILCFSSLIRLVRGMSGNADIPSEYRRFLDAIPSLHIGEEMTRTQKAFWYGAPDAVVGGEIRTIPQSDANDMSQVVMAATVVAAIGAAWYFFA